MLYVFNLFRSVHQILISVSVLKSLNETWCHTWAGGPWPEHYFNTSCWSPYHSDEPGKITTRVLPWLPDDWITHPVASRFFYRTSRIRDLHWDMPHIKLTDSCLRGTNESVARQFMWSKPTGKKLSVYNSWVSVDHTSAKSAGIFKFSFRILGDENLFTKSEQSNSTQYEF